MNTTIVAKAAKCVVPRPIKRRCRELLENAQFRLDLLRFKKLGPRGRPPEDLLRRLVVGWKNEWSAQWEYLSGILDAVANSAGPVLECGSGITTLLAGIRCMQLGRRLYSLEHDPDWASRLQLLIHRYRIDSVTINTTAIVSYGNYSWYELSNTALPSGINVVICDGPPGTTPGGRVGLIPQLKGRLSKNCQILLDDAARPGEQSVLKVWECEFEVKSQMRGIEKPYALVSLTG